MRLWFVFNILIFFVLLAFASARSVGKQEAPAVVAAETGVAVAEEVPVPAVEAAEAAVVPVVAGEEAIAEAGSAAAEATTLPAIAAVVSETATEVVEATTQLTGPARFCKCQKLECNCCREFRLPVIPVTSAGCASLQYLSGDRLALTMRIGDAVLRNITISGRRARPACVNMPGGYSQFCGRVYGISRQGDDFKACLGLELRALSDLEASLRVSCFRFSQRGVTLEPAPPLPVDPPTDEDEDDDDDGLFGLGGDDEDDEDDDDDDLPFADDDDEEEEAATQNDVSDTDADYTGFSVLGGTIGDIFGGIFEDEAERPPKKKNKPAAEKKPALAQSPQVNKVDITTARAKPVEIATAKPMEAPITAEDKIDQQQVTTERQPTTTIVLSPTSSVKITTTVVSTTPKAEVPDPETVSEEEKEEEEGEEDEDEDEDEELLNEEFGDDDDETTENVAVTDVEESFSNELAEAIKGVEEELTSVGEIELETDDDSDEKPATPDSAGQATTDTAADDELDIIEEVEALADEVNETVADDPEPQGGVPLNGEPRSNTTTTTENPKRQRASKLLKRLV